MSKRNFGSPFTVTKKFLLLSAFLMSSPLTGFTQDSSSDDIDMAIEARDADGLTEIITGKELSLDENQSIAARLLLLEHLVALDPAEDEKREQTARALLVLDPENRVAAEIVNSEPESDPEADDVATVLPEAYEAAIAARDGGEIVKLILSQGDAPVRDFKERAGEIEEIVLEYARPIPASNAKANKEAYKVLSLLNEDVATYKEKHDHYSQAEIEQANALLGRLKKKTDEFTGTTFYEHPNTPRYTDSRHYFLPYLAERNGYVTVRFRVNYTNDSWLFVEKLAFSIDGDVHPFPASEWKRDNDSEIWEWVDVAADASMLELIEKIANSKKTIARFDGRQYYDNVTVPESDKLAMREILQAAGQLRQSLNAQK